MSALDDMAEFKKVPKDYVCNESGVYFLDEDKEGNPKKIQITTKPIVVKAISRDKSGDNWGVLVWWKDLDNKVHELALPKKLFHARGTDIQQLLADGGLPIRIGRERDLLNYLASFNVKDRLIAASCTGWLHDAFVLPTHTIREPAGNKVVYQPSGFSNVPKAIHSHGTLKDWQSGLANASEGLRFLVCASLSAPVRYKTGIEAGGFHIYNTTSQGKTTALQAASSVWGNGVDPAISGGDGAYIQRWNATGNALEAVAECFNDLPLVIDEIGEGDPREFGKTIYRIISGTGKSRLKDTANLRNNRSWRVTVLSAGELAVSAFIESGGGQVKGGQLVRMIDVDLSQLEALFSGADEANAMKKHCALHYGHAGVELISRIDDLSEGWKEFDYSVIGTANTPIAKRVLTRFALVAHTGIIAVKAGILPWTESQVISSVNACYSAWHSQIDIVSDVDRGVDAIRDFILSDDARFERDNSTPIPQNRAGWFRGDMYHFAPKAFKEACKGVDAVKVKKSLKELGYLHINKVGKLTSNISVGKTSTSVVSVKAEILNKSLLSGGIRGNTGTKPENSTNASNTPTKIQGVTGVTPNLCNTPNTPTNLQGVMAESHVITGIVPPVPLIPLKNSQCKNNSGDEEVFF